MFLPIKLRVNLEIRVNIFDQISAIGGTLGLFTGVSLITFVEVIYWLVRFISITLVGEPGEQKRINMTFVEQTINGKEKEKSVEAKAQLDPRTYGFI